MKQKSPYSDLFPSIWKTILWVVVVSCGLIVVYGLWGCNPAKRIARIGAKHPLAFSRACSIAFPTKDSVTGKTIYLSGKTDTVSGITIDCDSVAKMFAAQMRQTNSGTVPSKALTSLKIPCPPSYYRVDTIYKDSSHYITGGPEYALLRLERDSAFSQSQKDKDARIKAQQRLAKSEKQKWITWVAIFLLIAGTVAFKFFKPKLL